MFDQASASTLLARPSGRRSGSTRHSSSEITRFALALAIAIVASPFVAAVSPQTTLGADSGASEAGTQYLEAKAHEGQSYHFTPGGAATVPYKPRGNEAYSVDGGPPVALPAAKGATSPAVIAPSAQPQIASGNKSTLRREVYGFLPYWELSSTLNYDALSTIAYFGVWMNGDGSLTKSGNGWDGWKSAELTNVINAAHAHGARVALTIEAFAWNSGDAASQTALLSNPAVRATGIANIVAEVTNSGVDGVNLDFEPIASGQSANFVAFVRELRAALDAAHPGYELAFCGTGAPGTYDLPNLLADGAADAVFIMAYPLRGGSPAYTGSQDPLTSSLTTYSLTKVVGTYLSKVAPSKVILGLPWYGEAWSTGTNTAVNAPPLNNSTYGQPASGVTYPCAKALADQSGVDINSFCGKGTLPSGYLGWQYDWREESAWTGYYGNYGGTSNTWRELYFDDPVSFGRKCDAIDGWNLRGLGIWALGYDNHNGNGDLTAVIVSKFLGVPSSYTPILPTRLADTRTGQGIASRLTTGVPRQLQIVASTVVPAGATAITGNLTVTGSSAKGWVYMGPTASASPSTSTINFPVGDTRANGVTVPLAADGSDWLTFISPTAGATTQVVFDVTGYFMPNVTGYLYKPLGPTRLLDTRINKGLAGAFAAGVARTLPVVGAPEGVVPADATAVTGNLTVTGQNSGGWLYVGPDPTNSPGASTLNFPVGDNRANNVTVKLGLQPAVKGTISITYVAPKGSSAQVIFDVTGYYTSDPTGNVYVPLPPSRVLDTRSGNGLAGAFSSTNPRTLGIATRGYVPNGATAVTGNLTVTNQSSQGWMYIGPTPIAQPGSSTLNFPVGDVRANGVAVAMAGGTVGITYVAPRAGASTQVVFDVTGYFMPVPAR